MTRKVLNFCAGPAMLPEDVMLRAQEDLLDWNGTGMSVMEFSHRGDEFKSIADHAEQTLLDLLSIPDDYHVLFLAGGATQQFSVIPMNLKQDKTCADYLHTGIWSAKAMKVADPLIDINVVCSGESTGFTAIPDRSDWKLNPEAAYCYYTANETISGLEFHYVPDVDVPLVSDMTSSILSRPINVSDYGLIFAGAQKNIGPAGLTLVIIKDALLGEVLPFTPDLLDYRLQAKEKSMLNTPPTFNWYMAGLMFDWVKEQGGVKEMQQRNERKASMLYELIDESGFYQNNIEINCRSLMNVVFTLNDANLNGAFLSEAKANGLYNLKGHRLAGGMRASLYNAMPESGVRQLTEFMREFEQTHG